MCAPARSHIRCTFAGALSFGLAALLLATSVVVAVGPSSSTVQSRSSQLDTDKAGLMPTPAAASLRVVAAHWAAITDQRRDVLDINRPDVVRILRGITDDWSELGGSAQPITVYLPRSQVHDIARSLGLAVQELLVELLPDKDVVDRVASTPGAFAMIQSQHLRLGVLALTVDGHDPYRDPGFESPLRLLRWIRGPRTLTDLAMFAAVVREMPRPFDPVGMAITGELLPVRCTNHALTQLDDYEAMFNGVREVLVAADLAVAPLEHPLTADSELTPCVVTVIFTGSHRAVPAMANAGLDVMFTIGNHMMDCWGGCNGVEALNETLDRLREAGIVTVGAGENLEAARTPAVVSVDTDQGPVSFAFLGYDIIAPWYHAGEDKPGTAPLDAEYLREDIERARHLADPRDRWHELGCRIHVASRRLPARTRRGRDRSRRQPADRQSSTLGSGGRAF